MNCVSRGHNPVSVAVEWTLVILLGYVTSAVIGAEARPSKDEFILLGNQQASDTTEQRKPSQTTTPPEEPNPTEVGNAPKDGGNPTTPDDDSASVTQSPRMTPQPKDADGYFSRARKLLEVRQLEQALADLTQFLTSQPNDLRGHWYRADTLWKLGRREEALANYYEVVRLTAQLDGFAVYRNRGYSQLRLGRYDAALADLDRATEEKPNDYEVCLCRGKVLEELRRPEEAVEQYSALIKIDPRRGIGYLKRGNIRMRMGQHDAGLADQKQAVRLGRLEVGGLQDEVDLVYIAPESLVEFRFIYVPPSTRWVGYAEEQRTEVAVKSQQLMFGHNATPLRTVQLLKGYFILDREVTHAQFAVFGKRALDIAQPAASADTHDQTEVTTLSTTAEVEGQAEVSGVDSDDNQPIGNLTWHEAVSFCRDMQKRLGLVLRLPTEVEWECAAREHSHWVYPWGVNGFYAHAAQHAIAEPRILDYSTCRDRTPSGLYDMAGNLSEWCHDTYQNQLLSDASSSIQYMPLPEPENTVLHSPSDKPERKPARTDPRLARLMKLVPDRNKAAPSADSPLEDHTRRTYRGGSYQDNQFNCQVPVRRAIPASERTPIVGFRPVLLIRTAK